MTKYIKINILNKDCRGIYFLTDDTNTKEITSTHQANKLINEKTFKLQLRIKANEKRAKKVFTFSKGVKNQTLTNRGYTTFTKALEYISSKRNELKDTLLQNGTLKEIPTKEEHSQDDEVITFLDLSYSFLEAKEISLRHSNSELRNSPIYFY